MFAWILILSSMAMKTRVKSMNRLVIQDDNEVVSYQQMVSPSANWQIISNNFGVAGMFSILQIDQYTSVISFSLDGVPEGSHSVHIHESEADGTNWGATHGNYDPYKDDGEEIDKENNYGASIWNLGVLNSPSDKTLLEESFYSEDVKLYGETSVIYRSIVIHEKEGDNYDDNNDENGAKGIIAWCNINYT